VCNLIIDSDNCKNVMLTKAIEKLQLMIEKRFKPYNKSWLNQDIRVIIDKHYLDSFFTSKR